MAPSFSSLELALPVGLALPSLGVGLGRGWPFGSGLERPRPKREKARPEREGQGPSHKGRKGRTTQESRKGEAGPDPKGEDGKAHLLLIYI